MCRAGVCMRDAATILSCFTYEVRIPFATLTGAWSSLASFMHVLLAWPQKMGSHDWSSPTLPPEIIKQAVLDVAVGAVGASEL